MWTTLRSVILAAILAPAVLFLPPLPQSADGAETATLTPAVSAVQATTCEQAAWPYKAACADQTAASGSPQLRLISTDRVAPIVRR